MFLFSSDDAETGMRLRDRPVGEWWYNSTEQIQTRSSVQNVLQLFSLRLGDKQFQKTKILY